jgi:hypothetical protein
MLAEVVIQSSDPMTLKVEDVDPDEILILKSITGLSPDGIITLFTGDYARDGGYYQGRRVGKRAYSLNFKLNPNYKLDIGASDIRELLYKMFLEPQVTSDQLTIVVREDLVGSPPERRRPDRYFVAIAEGINTDMWDYNQSAQVNMVAVDPYLRSVDETADADAAGWLSVPIAYDGSAETGFKLQVKVTTVTPTITIDLNGQLMTLGIDPPTLSTNFALNDIIDINTNLGERSIKRNGVDAMNLLYGTPVWPKLSSVANTLKVYGAAENDGKVKAMSYSYRSAWWGI